MSCIPSIGRRNYDGNEKLPRHSPAWTESKRLRLAEMTVDPDPVMRAVAAAHPNIDTLSLIDLLRDHDVAVRRIAVRNPRITLAQLTLALNDEDLGIRAYAKLRTEEKQNA